MMKNMFKKITVSTPIVLFTSLMLTTHTVYADFVDDAQSGVDTVDTGTSGTSLSGILTTIVNALLFLAGAVSLIMIIIGGLRFIFASDQQAAAGARNTVLYSVVGLIVAGAAYGIVNYVLDKLY